MNDVALARGLGWASLAIAATEILGQGKVEKDMLGIDEHPALLRSLGVREALAGVTILSQKSVTPTLAAGVWSRVLGDAMDLVLLGEAATATRKPASLAASVAMVVGITALDVICAFRLQKLLNRQPKTPAKPIAEWTTKRLAAKRESLATAAADLG